MAARIISRKAPLSKLLEKLMAIPRAFAPSSQSAQRSFNVNDQMREASVDVDDRRSDDRVSRRHHVEISPFLYGAFDPLFPTHSLSGGLNLMDPISETPLAAEFQGAERGNWAATEDNSAIHLRIEMPGLGKEHVKVSAEQSTLIIKGEGEKEFDGDEHGHRYSSRIELPEGSFKMDQIKAEMKNGVLTVLVPKVKDEERKDVFQIQID